MVKKYQLVGLLGKESPIALSYNPELPVIINPLTNLKAWKYLVQYENGAL